jgi:transposase-like protein
VAWDDAATRRSSAARSWDLVEAGRPIAEVAKALGISDQSIYTWHRQDRIDRGLEPGLTSAEKVELAAAKRRIAELETELRATRRAMELVREVATDNTVTLIGTSPTTPRSASRQRRRRGHLPPGRHPRVRQGDQWTDGEASFFRITCWRQLAEHVTEILGKGARAIVIGRLRLRSWETDQGERRSLVEVEADEIAPR